MRVSYLPFVFQLTEIMFNPWSTLHGSSPPPQKFKTKIIGGDLSKKFNLGGAKFKGGPKILGGGGGPMNIVSKGGHTILF